MGGNILVGLSGGPSSAINASLAGVIHAASGHYDKLYGAVNGIHGVLERRIVELSEFTDEESLRILCQTPAMALGSCRKKLCDTEFENISNIFEEYNIKSFFYIGGNDSMDTVDKLSKYFAKTRPDINIIGVPKTIDNDLPVTDHSPGFGSAAKYLYHTMDEIICDSMIYPVKSVVIVEVMGRDSGWLTLAAALPSFLGKKEGMPQLVAIPEVAFDQEKFISDIRRLLDEQKTVICAVSEGIKDKSGQYVGMEAKSGAVDTFGHVYLSGVGKYLEGLVAREIGCKVRSIELNIMQRCSAHLASRRDIEEAFAVGSAAVAAAKEGKSGITMVFNRVSSNPYKIEISETDVSNIANRAALVPQKWFDFSNPSVRQEIADYILPLIQGNLEFLVDENELPRQIRLY